MPAHPRPRHTAYCVSRRTAFRRGRGHQAKAMYVLVIVLSNPRVPNCTVTPSALNVVSGDIPLVEQPGTNNTADLLDGFDAPEEYSPTSTSDAFSGSVIVLPATTVIFPASIILTLPAPPPAPALSIMLGTSLVQGANKRSYAPPPVGILWYLCTVYNLLMSGSVSRCIRSGSRRGPSYS